LHFFTLNLWFFRRRHIIIFSQPVYLFRDYRAMSEPYRSANTTENPPAGRITELRESFERSLEQVRYQALLLNNVRDAVVVWNTQGTITYVNPAALALFGWSKEQILSLPVETYLNCFTPTAHIPAGEGTGGLRVERQFSKQDSKSIWVSSHVYALRDPGDGGRLIGYMDVCRDITESKEMEARVQIVQTQLIHAARLAAIGELAAGVAHHVNNPLTTIIAEAQLLLHSLPEGHPNRVSAEAIEAAGWRVQKAVQRLLDFSQPAGDMIDSVDVNETINSALELVGEQIQASGASLQVELGEAVPHLRGNARQLVDLWLNLLMLSHWSAIDGRPHSIGIRSGHAAKNGVQVEISDNGQPLSPGAIGTLFEPGYLTTPRGRGTGVELALCQEIVHKHHGQISAESTSNGVTIFRVYLPGR